MTYRSMGAGPGPVKKYSIDMPFPWGKDTEVVVPIDEMVGDTWAALSPHIDQLEAKMIQDMEDEMNLYAPRLVKQIMDESVRPELNRQAEVAMAEFDVMKMDVVKAVAIVGVTVVLAMGIGSWWVKKG